MAYEYSDPKNAEDPRPRPDLEVFYSDDYEPSKSEHFKSGTGFYYAFRSLGGRWASDPVGPFGSYDEALTAAREVE